jgi:hypothetical protein
MVRNVNAQHAGTRSRKLPILCYFFIRFYIYKQFTHFAITDSYLQTVILILHFDCDFTLLYFISPFFCSNVNFKFQLGQNSLVLKLFVCNLRV